MSKTQKNTIKFYKLEREYSVLESLWSLGFEGFLLCENILISYVFRVQ